MGWRLISRKAKAPVQAAPKRKRKTRRFLLVLGCVVAAVLALEAGAYFYLFGGLKTDREFRQYTDEELGAVDVEQDVTGLEAQTEVMTPLEQEGELLYSVIPDDVLERYYSGSGKMLRRRLLEGAEKIQVFVLYGIDDYDRAATQAATDAIMVVALDPVHHKIKLISISRDTYVYYPAYEGMTKLNYAYTFGGIPGAVSTLNTNFFLNVSDYIAVSMTDLAEVVDLVDGVTVDLTQEEIDASSALWGFSPGENRLNGEQATAYARIRSVDNDTKRSNRQFAVISSLLRTARQTSYSKYPALIRACLNLCTTSFSSTDLLSMSTLLLDGELQVEHTYIPDSKEAWGGLIDDRWYYVYDTLVASDEIYKIIYEDLYESEFIDAA